MYQYLADGDPDGEVQVDWRCHQQLRAACRASLDFFTPRKMLDKLASPGAGTPPRPTTFGTGARGQPIGPVGDIPITLANSLAARMRTSLAWDQGSEMAKHAALAMTMPGRFAHSRSPRDPGSNENANELNDRPRVPLGFHTQREMFDELLNDNVVSAQ